MRICCRWTTSAVAGVVNAARSIPIRWYIHIGVWGFLWGASLMLSRWWKSVISVNWVGKKRKCSRDGREMPWARPKERPRAATIVSAACCGSTTYICIIVAPAELLIMWQLDVAFVASHTGLLWQQVERERERVRAPFWCSKSHRELNGLIKQVD